jgi:hypothetical protein
MFLVAKTTIQGMSCTFLRADILCDPGEHYLKILAPPGWAGNFNIQVVNDTSVREGRSV